MDMLSVLLSREGWLNNPDKVKKTRTLGDYFPVQELEGDLHENAYALVPQPMGAGKTPREISAMDRIYVAPDKRFKNAKHKNFVRRHEMDHVYTGRNAPDEGYERHPLYEVDNVAASWLRADLITNLIRKKEELAKKYPELAESGYFKDPKGVSLTEIMADLNAVQDMYGVDLTKDPLFFDTFKSTKNREFFDAASGNRRTRLDARDPIPFDPRGYK